MLFYHNEDHGGYFYCWGNNISGHKKWTKYYYEPHSKQSRIKAAMKAIKQGLLYKFFVYYQ